MDFWLQFISIYSDTTLDLGPFEGIQLTYKCLRDTRDGRTIAKVDDEGYWHIEPGYKVDTGPWSDVVILTKTK
jgi:hypothetical protein